MASLFATKPVLNQRQGFSNGLNSFIPLPGTGAYDALKQTTDRLVVEHEQAERKALIYKQKLVEAENYVKRLEQAYQDLSTRNGKLRSVAADDHTTVNTLSSKILKDQELIANLQNTVSLLDMQVDKITVDRTQVLAELEFARTTAKDMVCKLSFAVSEVENLRHQLQQAVEARSQMEATHADVAAKLTAANNSLAAEQEASLQQITALTANLAIAHDTNTDHQSRITELSATLEDTQKTLSSNLAAVEASLNDSEATIAAITSDLMTMVERTDTLATALKKEQQGKDAVEKRAAELQKSYTKLEQEYQALNKAHESILIDLEAVSVVCEAAEKELASVQAKYNQAVQGHAAELAELQKAQHSQQATTAKAQEQAKKEIEALKAELDVAQKHLNQTKAEAEKSVKEAAVQRDQELAAWRQRAAKELDDIREATTKEVGTVLHEVNTVKAELGEKQEQLNEMKKSHDKEAKQFAEKDAKRDQEMAKLEHRLDEVNQSWTLCEAKLTTATTGLQAAAKANQAKDNELTKARAAMQDLEARLEEVQRELEAKRQLLSGISAVAAQAEKQHSQPSTGKKKKNKASPSSGGSGRSNKRVHFSEPLEDHQQPDWPADNNDNDDYYQDEEEEEEEHVQDPRTAMVVHSGDGGRKTKKQQPVVEEPSDSDEEEQDDDDDVVPVVRKAPPPAIRKAAPTAPAAKPTKQHKCSRRMGAMAGVQKDKRESKKDKKSKSKSKKNGGGAVGGGQFQSVLSLFGGLAGSYSPHESSLS